jgi:hypothetical protein
MKEWDEHMSDFVPADMMNFQMPSRTEEVNEIAIIILL